MNHICDQISNKFAKYLKKALWFTFIVNLCRHFFHFRKKGPKWTIYKHVSDKTKKCLSVGNFGIQTIVCVLAPTYTLCRSLKYLLKVRYIILIRPQRSRIFDFQDRFSRQVGNTALCLKIISQKWATFAFSSTYLH